MQEVKIVKMFLLKILPYEEFCNFIGLEGRIDQNDKSHCIIFLHPQMSNPVQKVKIIYKLSPI